MVCMLQQVPYIIEALKDSPSQGYGEAKMRRINKSHVEIRRLRVSLVMLKLNECLSTLFFLLALLICNSKNTDSVVNPGLF